LSPGANQGSRKGEKLRKQGAGNEKGEKKGSRHTSFVQRAVDGEKGREGEARRLGVTHEKN